MQIGRIKKWIRLFTSGWLLTLTAGAGSSGFCAEPPDPLLNLLIQKGMLSQEEANRVQIEADAIRTNRLPMPESGSKWKLSKAFKNVELFGDVRLRFEHREASTPEENRIELDRGRAAVRLGLRGEALDNFYFGIRLDTSSNPRSPWVTLGSSSPSPFGKSSFGVNVGQAYVGWRPWSWLDITVGKMPNPLYTTAMVWDPDLNPEGAAERFKFTAGSADFFANFGQFLYQDNNPSFISGDLVQPLASSSRLQDRTSTTFLLAWQVGVNYHFSTNISLKIAPVLYNYIGLVTNISVTGGSSPNGIGDPFIGEGSFGGPNSSPIPGLTSQGSVTYNQVGVNNLLVLDIPIEFNFKLANLNFRLFGDYAYNFEGSERADAAFNALAATVAGTSAQPPLLGYGPQRGSRAYQVGLGVGSAGQVYGPTQGLVYGSTTRKHAWEFRTYWQRVEQYALDPNLLDSDFFEGRGNMEGIFAAMAYGLSDNAIATVRYGYGKRINDNLGTGGNNLDIPQLNPIHRFSILQLDLTFRF
jgi:hypothetical protein